MGRDTRRKQNKIMLKKNARHSWDRQGGKKEDTLNGGFKKFGEDVFMAKRTPAKVKLFSGPRRKSVGAMVKEGGEGWAEVGTGIGGRGGKLALGGPTAGGGTVSRAGGNRLEV